MLGQRSRLGLGLFDRVAGVSYAPLSSASPVCQCTVFAVYPHGIYFSSTPVALPPSVLLSEKNMVDGVK